KDGGGAAPADRKKADWLEPRHRPGPAGRPRNRQPPVSGVDLTPCNTAALRAPPGNEKKNVANSEDRAFRRRGDRSPQSRGRHREPGATCLAGRIPGGP